MCWIDYYPVIPEGCHAAEQHIAMRKRVSPCSKVFAASFHAVISQQTSETMEEKINKTLFKMYQASVTASSYNVVVPPTGTSVFEVCPPERCKVIESYHRELCRARLQAKDPYCPVCKGEVGKYESLTIKGPVHYAILSNGHVLRAPGVVDEGGPHTGLLVRIKDIAPNLEEDKKLLRAEKDMLTLSGWKRWKRL